MLFNRLVETIERHSDDIVTSLVAQIRADHELKRLRELPEPDLRHWASSVVTRLSAWLSPDENGVRMSYELGERRQHQHVPLPECVRGILLLKNTVVDFLREQSFANTELELYAEEELEHLVHRSFDRILYNFVRGYDDAAERNHALAHGAGHPR